MSTRTDGRASAALQACVRLVLLHAVISANADQSMVNRRSCMPVRRTSARAGSTQATLWSGPSMTTSQVCLLEAPASEPVQKLIFESCVFLAPPIDASLATRSSTRPIVQNTIHELRG